jgi:hypothetical protein
MPGIKGGRPRNFGSIMGKTQAFFSLSEAHSTILGLDTTSYLGGTKDFVSDVERPGLQPIANLYQIPTLEICTAKLIISLMVHGIHRNRHLKNVRIRIQLANLLIP